MPRLRKSLSIEAPELSDEKELALAFNRGEPDAYRVIYERYETRVQAICRRLLNDPHDAQEAAQEVFTRVYQALPRFNGRYQLGAWIVRITTNVCLDQIRSRTRHPSDPAPLEELQLDVDAPADDEPETAAIRRAESRHVRRVLAALPPMHRAAIVLRDFEGLSYQDVAIALGITECQTKALIHRARQGFKRAWLPLDALQLILPWKLVQRLKKVDVSATDGASQVARASAPLTEAASSVAHVAHAASSCSIAIQQCGQFMAERATALAATVIVGTAAMGGVAVGRATAPQPVQPRSEIVVSAQPVKEVLPRAGTKKHLSAKPKSSVVASNPVETTPAAEPTPTASPSATPQPTPTPQPTTQSSGSGEKTTGGSEPTPAPAPKTPFEVALGFDRATQTPSAPPQSHSSVVDCASMQLQQELQAPVWDEDGSYPGRLTLQMSGGSAQLALYVLKDGVEYSYNGGASSLQVSKGSNGTTTVSFAGSYSWHGGPPPSDDDLPISGRFSARIVVDCAASRLVTESIALST